MAAIDQEMEEYFQNGGPPAGAAAGRPETDKRPRRDQVKVFGGKAALTIEADDTRRGEDTIRLEGAKAIRPKQYNWGEKIAIQMTTAELPIVAQVFLGLRESCEFKNHGEASDKGFSVARQEKGLFVRVFSSKGVCAVPVGAPDAYYFGSLVLAQLKKNSFGLEGAELLAMIRGANIG